jgi:DNA-binding transcriptional regulator YdaS (Cro superfamily)
MHARAMQRAARNLGGPEALQKYLGVSMTRLKLWIDGVETPPADVFLKIVDIVMAPEPRSPED